MSPRQRAIALLTTCMVPVVATWLRRAAEGAVVRAPGVADAVREASSGCRRTVFYYYNCDAFALAVAVLNLQRLGEAGYRELQVVHDESFGGCLTAGLVRAFGAHARLLRRQKAADRAADLREMLRTDWNIAIAVDGHGPYGSVGEPFARFVDRFGACAIPVAASMSRGWRVPVRAPMCVPSRGGIVSVATGGSLQGAPSKAVLASALNAAKNSADKLLVG